MQITNPVLMKNPPCDGANDFAPIVSLVVVPDVLVVHPPEIRDRLLSPGVTTVGGTPEQRDAGIKSESAKWKKVIEAAGARPE